MSKKLEIKIKAVENSLSDTFGKFIVKPLERGYGVTIGNDLTVTNHAPVGGNLTVQVI